MKIAPTEYYELLLMVYLRNNLTFSMIVFAFFVCLLFY
jgi:hypothetical protein